MNILFLPYCHQIGSVHSLVTIGKYLKSKGHSVVFAGEGPYLEIASNNGLDTDFIHEIPIEKYRECTDKGELEYQTTDEIDQFVEEERKLFEKHQTDLVISTLRFTAPISTEIAKIPHIGLIYAVLTNYYSLDISVPETHFLYKFRKIKPVFFILTKASKYLLRYFMGKYVKPYNTIAERYQVKPFKNLYTLYEGDLTWIFDAKEFAPIDNNGSFHFLGPIFNKVIADPPPFIDKVKQIRRDSNRKSIYLSMGSSGILFPNILNDLVGYCKEKNLILLANSCNHKIQEDYNDGENIFLCDFASAEEMLSLSDIVVTHGGRGTLYDTLEKKLPLVIIPHQAEQEWNAARAEDLGLGIKVPKIDYTKDLLLSSVEKILNNYQKYSETVQKFSECFDRYDWRATVDNTIQSLTGK